MNLLLMALCGGVGAVCRFVLDAVVRGRAKGSMPWGTLLVNLLGSLLLGLLTAATARQGMRPDVKLVLGTGFCGGFTTFSTASVECVRLVQKKSVGLALAYLLATAAGCLATAALGYWLG